MDISNALTIEKFEFQKSKMQTATVLKTVKLPYLCNCSTDFDEIWHGRQES